MSEGVVSHRPRPLNRERVADLLRQLADELDPREEAPRPRGRTAALLAEARPTEITRAAARRLLHKHGLPTRGEET